MTLIFQKVSSDGEVKKILDYSLDAFSDTPDFNWNLAEIKKEMADGWEMYGVYVGPKKEIIASVFIKEEEQALLTKNTAVKSTHQGSGHSHEIKAFFEKQARSRKLDSIKHYCSIDNFRIYSLNEGHRYQKSDKKIGVGQVVEWIKKIK